MMKVKIDEPVEFTAVQDNMIDEEKAKAEAAAQENLEQKLSRLEGNLGRMRCSHRLQAYLGLLTTMFLQFKSGLSSGRLFQLPTENETGKPM